ncbi:hypothetical protein PFFCH_04863 [Plasmodium falciparum FCH/4]|uniref:GPI transamidase subunit PIG-U n=1 Tax=Plasmodium falciparum FCH/4 TaxID=1036724 RepID=A0A024VHH4_PLAFA|nr:hypothetical protein PFFCH_04863 [Plasmodium falciparum FCH/4]
MNECNTKKIQNGDKTKRKKYTYLFLSILICFVIRIFIFFLLNILEGSTYEYINKLINVDLNIQHIKKYDESRELKENINNINKKGKHMEKIYDDERNNKNNLYNINNNYYNKIDIKIIKTNKYIKELELYFQKNKRYNNLRSFLLKNDYMHYLFNTDIYNLKYLYDSYVLRILKKDMYSSLVIRINPIFLKILHFLLFKPIKINIDVLIKICNNYEFRFFLFICIIDILIAIFLFLIIDKLNNWNTYFLYIISNNYTTPHFNIINPLLLINIYLNNPINILANSFLSLDNFKLLIITANFYLTLSRIQNVSNQQKQNVYKHKYKRICSFFNLLLILFHNAILLYITSFHFILVVIGINNFIIYIEEDFLKRYHIKQNVQFCKLAHMLFKNMFLLLITLIIYALFIVISYFQNSHSLSFLNNTVINEYKILLLLPNLGNFWYIFSTFHIFLYPVPLFFRLVKTPLIYLKVLIAIALVFQPNITINDIVYSLITNGPYMLSPSSNW